jgi:adenine-specific DNA-methyltransferase
LAPEKDKTELKSLVENFHRNQATYKSISGSTEILKKDFIIPFFKCLGWDTANKTNQPISTKDLLHENSIIIPGKPKPPDYSFRIGGVRKFFVEVRNPSFPIFEHEEGSLQLRRYGYTANLSLSILTDLEEFAVYDTRMKPDKNDDPEVGRVFYCSLKDYHKPSSFDPKNTNLEWIYSIFSKTAVMNGSLERFTESIADVNYACSAELEFLKRIDEWRFMLAREIAILNQELSIEQINYAVQKMLDRFIILRIAEDLNMERYAILYQVSMIPNAYPKLLEIFHKVDEKINSRIFRSEQWLENIQIGDSVLFSIIQQLYYPDCPFEFSVFSTKSLEDIFEQFLAKTIQFSKKKGKQTKIPEITKISPGFTTPSSVVSYMVEQTLGRYLAGQDKTSIQDLKVLDPYCRTGKFLVSAFECLLQFYRLHSKEDEKIWIPERQNILLRHIFGIDPDPHALEITKMSIFLKVIENLSKKEIEPIIKNPHLRIMPGFHNNLFQSRIQSHFEVMLFSPPAFPEDCEKTINLADLIHESLQMLKPNGWLSCLIDSTTFFKKRGDTFLHYLIKKTTFQEISIIEQDINGKYPFSVLLILQNKIPKDNITHIQLGMNGPRKHLQQYEINLEILKDYSHLFA